MKLGLLGLIVVVTTLLSCEAPVVGYPWHTGVTATVFWVGEPQGGGSSEDNALSAWDDRWLEHYGGVDDPGRRKEVDGYFPAGFTPRENPFYADLPYDDFDARGRPRADRETVVPWAGRYQSALAEHAARHVPFSLLKNRWLQLRHDDRVCYAQWEDSGPYVYDDAGYVFGADDRRPRNTRANAAGLDVSPAVRDCLGFPGLNDAESRVDWRFVDDEDVPDGPWKRVVTPRQVFWP